MVDFKRVLESHTLAELRKIVAKMNVANYIKVKGKDIKIGKKDLIKLMVSHYSGGIHDGKDTISRSNYLPESKGVLGAKLDKETLLESIREMVETGEIDEKEAKMIYRQQLQLLQDEGAIHKGKRKATKKVKEVKKKKVFKKKIHHFKESNRLLDLIEFMVGTTKKEAKKMAIEQGYEKPKDVSDAFWGEYNKHAQMVEDNPEDVEHIKGLKDTLQKYQKLTKTKASKNKLGITPQEGEGIGSLLLGVIPSLVGMIGNRKQKGGGLHEEEEGEGFEGFVDGLKKGAMLGLKVLPML